MSEAEGNLDLLPSSSLYAAAAFLEGCSYVNFTPSLGSHAAALVDLAQRQQTAHAGRDGKTGETFLKSVLGPAFAQRNLTILSWVGHNILGNMDAQVLQDPQNKQSKVHSKDQLIGRILGYQPQMHTSIENIHSLGDWKTAWDHVHFQGFLGTRMTMQFTWQGCDSILAAPLVLDLFRLVERSQRAGQVGALTHLNSFFKSPLSTDASPSFAEQFRELQDWCEAMAAESHDIH